MQPCQIETRALPDTPATALLALHRNRPDLYPVLFESAAAGTPQGRYTILLARPGERLVSDREGAAPRPGGHEGFLARLDDWWQRERVPSESGEHWPVSSGWFLLLGYELAGEIEPSLRLPPAPDEFRSVAWRMRASVLHDHATGETVVRAEADCESLAADIRQQLSLVPPEPPAGGINLEVSEEDPARFRRAVLAALEHIAAGDVYQANLSRGWTARLPPDLRAADVYERLRRANPGPFSGIADIGDFAVVSSSPERLVRVRGRRAETRPIAGTRPRLGEIDAPSIAELIAHPKERAEHIMLIDLERNDLGRICEAGTVEVDELMSVESYAHVHHIVSNVRGILRPEVTPAAVIRALFPGGTITGCPKVRCMQLIADLEAEGRGAYTGSMGYLGRDGDLDLNILIRTLTIHRGIATLRAGAGIVADSDPERELEETRAKARGVLRALSEAP